MINLCKKDCSKCNRFNRCGGCSLCEAAICGEKCDKCASICRKRGSSVVYANKILDKDINLSGNKDLNLPGYIPIIPDKLKEKLNTNVISLHGGNVLKSNGKGVRKIYKENGYSNALNVSEGVSAILEFYVRDRTLEGIWDSRECIYKEINDLNLGAVIAPNFSVYEDAPRIEHLYNIQRSLIVYNELIESGINAIPDISWYNIDDLDFWVEKINRSECRIISFSFQVVDVRLKASNAWKNYIAGFRYLVNKLEKNIKIIIAGLNSSRRIEEIIKIVKDSNVKSIHILNQTAYLNSQRGVYSGGIKDIKTPKTELFKKNLDYLDELYKI